MARLGEVKVARRKATVSLPDDSSTCSWLFTPLQRARFTQMPSKRTCDSMTTRSEGSCRKLEMQFDESSSFLDLETGQVETVSHALLREAEESGIDDPDLPAWQKREWEIGKRIVSAHRFQALPPKVEV